MSSHGQFFIEVTTEPSVEPITTAEAKAFVREVSTDLDDQFPGWIQSAREWVEQYTGRSLVTQTLLLQLPCFEERIYLPRGQVQSVTSVKYLDSAGAEQTVDPTLYDVHKPKRGAAYITRGYNATWPVARTVLNAVRVAYVAGYAPTGSPADLRGGIPESIKLAIKRLVQGSFEGTSGDDLKALQAEAERLLWPHRLVSF